MTKYTITTRLQIQWNSANCHQSQLGNKTKFQALKLIRKPAFHIVNSPKKVKAVVYKTFKFVLVLLSSSGDEESSELDQEQGRGDEDDFEEDN
jgi:hypothetical protein